MIRGTTGDRNRRLLIITYYLLLLLITYYYLSNRCRNVGPQLKAFKYLLLFLIIINRELSTCDLNK